MSGVYINIALAVVSLIIIGGFFVYAQRQQVTAAKIVEQLAKSVLPAILGMCTEVSDLITDIITAFTVLLSDDIDGLASSLRSAYIICVAISIVPSIF